MAKRLPFAFAALIWLLPASVAHSQANPQRSDPIGAVILLSLETCCKGQYWPETETNIVKELALQDIRVTRIEATSIDETTNESALLQVVKDYRVDGAMLVRRSSGQSAEIAFLVWDKVSSRSLHRRLPVPDIANADSAVTAALRAVEAISAGYEEVIKGVVGAAPPPVAERQFGAMPATVAFEDKRDAKDRSAEAPTGRDEPDEPTAGTSTAGPSQDKAAPSSRDSEGPSAPVEKRASGHEEDREEAKPLRLALATGGDFSISPGGAGVRSGFAFGIGYSLYKGLGIEVDVGYAPFGSGVTKAGTTSAIDLVMIRGWARRRFRENTRVSPAVMIGGGGLLTFAKGIKSLTGADLKSDNARVGIGAIGVNTRISITGKMAVVPGASIGMTFPKVVLKHDDKTAATLGRPLLEWTLKIEFGIR